jgi:hypothetical protein
MDLTTNKDIFDHIIRLVFVEKCNMFPVRYELDFYIIRRRYYAFKVLN